MDQAKELFEQLQTIIKDGDFNKAKTLLEENKDALGEYFEQAKSLLAGGQGLDGVLDQVKGQGLDGVLDKVKGLFGK